MRLLYLIPLLLSCVNLHAQIITTVAGNGEMGYSGDGGPAIDAALGQLYYSYPAFDKAGNMYIGNLDNTIRKIDAAGMITTIAGTNGVGGYSGDGGPATNALLIHPNAIVVDDDNNIIFCDANGNYIRKIDAAGIITTISGQATADIGVGDGGPLSGARFKAISALSLDESGNLYISDFGLGVVRKVNKAGIIHTIAGTGLEGFSGDGGPATSAQLAYPCKVGVDKAGNVYIPDGGNHRVRKIDAAGIITTIAGNGTLGYSGDGGPATLAQFSFPGSVVFDHAGNLYIGDYDKLIRKVDAGGIVTTYAGTGVRGYSGDGGPAIQAELTVTEGRLTIDENDNIYFSDEYNNVIRKITNCITAVIEGQPKDISLCNAGDAVFSISEKNAQSLVWQVNIKGTGWTSLADGGVYSGTSANKLSITGATAAINGYQYRCMATNTCGSIFSAAATLIVTPQVLPAVIISINDSNICEGNVATFTATGTNGGTLPTYQWKKNGADVGVNSATYSSDLLSNGDQISCILKSNSSCISNNAVASNLISVTVTPKLSPAISISSSANNICEGSSVNFSTFVQHGGSAPSYRWKKNGMDIGENKNTYSDNLINDGDIVTCLFTTNYACPTSPSALSNSITIKVAALVTPTVVINATQPTICVGKPATFSAVATNAGASPFYQWAKNGTDIPGATSTIFTDNSPSNGDVVSCRIVANGNCLISATANSNAINTSFFPAPLITLDHTSFICRNGSRQLDAGPFSSYVWNDRSTTRILLVKDTGKYYVTVTDINGCVGTDTVIITEFLASPSLFLPADTAVCNYGELTINAKLGYSRYLWQDNSTTPTLTVKQPNTYWLEVTDNNGCVGKDSIKVLSKQCVKGFFIPTAFTPNKDGKNDFFRPLIFGNIKSYQFNIYNRWGQAVFQSNDLTKGWDGFFKGQQQATNIFAWVCHYQLEGGEQVQEKGTVVLVR